LIFLFSGCLTPPDTVDVRFALPLCTRQKSVYLYEIFSIPYSSLSEVSVSNFFSNSACYLLPFSSHRLLKGDPSQSFDFIFSLVSKGLLDSAPDQLRPALPPPLRSWAVAPQLSLSSPQLTKSSISCLFATRQSFSPFKFGEINMRYSDSPFRIRARFSSRYRLLSLIWLEGKPRSPILPPLSLVSLPVLY